ncbi:hypothetical protein BS47DRAFT_1333910 [Hydnum rufescens UP504]|uniref:UBX domain-containing protein n=1 Tax=Hydnum rufescens UP504 TaxID=1448309 RepID=A0A9P6AI77_9AGAM|nr:hypothetical protein BS47DRAFT_1333910 [Hydnum rufescens UP504]
MSTPEAQLPPGAGAADVTSGAIHDGQVGPPETGIDISHHVKVYKPFAASTSSAVAVESIPDEYFEPTAAELQAAYASQQRRLDALVNAPLKTQAIREREQKARAARWPNTTIRIRFPDQTILERSFASTDKIKSVYQFVRASLIAEALNDKFILYQAPRRELKVSDPEVKSLSLVELDLAPSSVLFVKFQAEAYNNPNLPPPILPQLLDHAVAPPGSTPEPAAPTSGQ